MTRKERSYRFERTVCVCVSVCSIVLMTNKMECIRVHCLERVCENLVLVNKRFRQNHVNKSRCTRERLALGRSCFTQRECRTPFAGLRTAIARCVSSSLYIVITAASIASKTHHSAES